MAEVVQFGSDGVESFGFAQSGAEAAAVSVKVRALFRLFEPRGARDHEPMEALETEVELEAGACLISGTEEGFARNTRLADAAASSVVLGMEPHLLDVW